jgi:DNA-binding helix-hairpin-helix protein with protein kinase domain
MKQLPSCAACSGFLPNISRSCPHCGATGSVVARLGGVAATLATAAAFSSTLMACYGPMPAPPQPPEQKATTAPTAEPAPTAPPAPTTK